MTNMFKIFLLVKKTNQEVKNEKKHHGSANNKESIVVLVPSVDTSLNILRTASRSSFVKFSKLDKAYITSTIIYKN